MQKTRPTIFIDFDGVLHPPEYLGFKEINGELVFATDSRFCWVDILLCVLGDHPCDLVVHSSWRNSNSLAEIQSMLPRKLGARAVGITEGENRYEGILAYVSANRLETYIILDDMADEFPANCKELILCDGGSGISDQEIQEKILRFLRVL